MPNEVKIFRISGKYVKKRQYFSFTKYVRALKIEDAMEKVLSEITSIRLFRRKIQITEKKEVKPEDCTDQYVLSLNNL